MSGYTAFKVLNPPAITEDSLPTMLARGKVGTIDVSAGRDSAAGFASREDPLSTEFDPGDVWPIPGLASWSFRVDTIKVPPSALKLHVRKRIAENLAATGRDKMPRVERDELTESVRFDLATRTPPSIKAVPVVYNADTGILRIETTSAKMLDSFLSRMHERLGVDLEPLDSVGVIDSAFGASETECDEIYHLLPTGFAGGTGTEGEDD